MTCQACGRDHAADDERTAALTDALAVGGMPFAILLRLEESGWALERAAVA